MADRLWKIECDDPEINLYGLFRRKTGGRMRLFDFTMRMLSTYIPVGESVLSPSIWRTRRNTSAGNWSSFTSLIMPKRKPRCWPCIRFDRISTGRWALDTGPR